MKDEQRASIAISSDAYFFEKDKSESILILGIGNYLMGDEGVGVQLIQKMNNLELPSYLDILDGGTGGFLLLSCIEAYGHIIFVDATTIIFNTYQSYATLLDVDINLSGTCIDGVF